MALQSPPAHPHGLGDAVLDSIFTLDKPVIVAFHDYPGLIHRPTCKRTHQMGFHVHGYDPWQPLAVVTGIR